MDARSAAETLQEVDHLRRQTRRQSRTGAEQLWLPLVLFGALVLVTPVVEAAWGGRAVGIYWAVAAPAGALLCGRYYRKREHRVGLEIPALPYLLVSAGIVLGSLALGWIGGLADSQLAWVGPPLVVSAGYLIFAWLDRSAVLAVFAAALAAVVLGLYVSPIDDETAGVAATLSFGGIFLLAGLFLLGKRGHQA
jgi:hypothetical protein